MARSSAGALLFLIAGIGLVFANALGGSFHYDDFHSLVLNPHVRSWENAASFFTDPSLFSVDPTKAMYRPLVLLTYTVNHALGGYSPTGYLFVNLVLHLGCALLVWALARRLGAQPAGALWGAALFGLYPLCTEPVNYVSSRSESLAVLFQLVAFYCFLTGDTLRRRGMGWLSFMLALLSKSVAFVLPAVLIAYEVFWRGTNPVGAACTLLGFEWDLPFRNFCQSVLGRFAGQRTSGALRTAAHTEQGAYILCLYWNFSHPSQRRAPVLRVFFVGNELSICALGIGQSLRRIDPALSGRGLFFICWGLLSLAPTLVVPLNVLVNEHRLYALIAAAGVALSLEWQGWRYHVKWALCVWVCVAAMLTQERNQVWDNERSLWEDSARKSPGMARPQVFSATPCEKPGKERTPRLAMSGRSTLIHLSVQRGLIWPIST